MVSIHAPARGATSAPRLFPRRGRVSIHAPARGATLSRRVASGESLFQFTRPRGARRVFCGRRGLKNGFNSRAREGRDLILPRLCAVQRKFQFTRPRGARRRTSISGRRPRGFNSRAREGRDLVDMSADGEVQPVSIHAPARGATCAPAARTARSRVSIHAPARGATYAEVKKTLKILVSIHAPARGATSNP